MTSNGLRIPVVLLLLMAVGRIPIPWIHTHDAMSAVELDAHRSTYHHSESQAKLPKGWHMHFQCVGSNPTTPSGEGWSSTNPVEPNRFCRTDQPLVGCESNVLQLLHRLRSTDQNAIGFVLPPPADAPITYGRPAHLSGDSLRAFKQLSVMLI